MDIDVMPAAADAEHRALVAALERADVQPSGRQSFESSWRRAGLREAVDADDGEACYAFSPRNTRGATRA